MTKKTKQDSTISGGSKRKDALQVAAEYGIDISLLVSNLQKTPAERIRLHQIALNTADKLRKARRM